MSETNGPRDADDPVDATDSTVDATFVASFESGERPSEAIVEAVAELTGAGPAELSPLYDAIEPDALDALFDRSRTDGDRDRQRLAFTYAGFEIEVAGDGTIRLSPLQTAGQ